MFRGLIVLAAFLPAVAQAEDWVRLSEDAEIVEALADRTVIYGPQTLQVFMASGETRYITERASTGSWQARDGQYCSEWPPAGTWTCYDFEVNGDRVRFINSGGVISEGTYGN